MKFIIKHEVKGRLRIHVIRNRMTWCGGGYSLLDS